MNSYQLFFRRLAVSRANTARALCSGFLLLGAISASAESKPHIVAFDVPGAIDTGCFSDCAVSINNWGVITGSYLDANDVFHGFVRSPDGKFKTFEAPGADTTTGDYNGTFPNSINDAGVITGYYVDVSGNPHGFLRAAEGGFTTFDVPASTGTFPISLNLEGAVVGYEFDQNGVFRGFIRHTNGNFETWLARDGCDAVPAAGCYGTAAYSINLFGTIAGGFEDNSGNFVGQGLVRHSDGRFTRFAVPGAGTGTYQGTGCPGCTVAINQFGTIAGFYLDANNATRGYLRRSSGEIVKFDIPGEGSYGLGCSADCSLGLNDFDTVTSSYLDPNNVFHGFVRSADGNITTFEAPGADTTAGDYNGTFPVSVNDWGAVTGYFIDVNNVFHGFVLLP